MLRYHYCAAEIRKKILCLSLSHNQTPPFASESENQTEIPYHFYHFYLCLYSELIEESSQVLLHLDAVIIHLSYSKNPHFAFSPNLVREHRQYWNLQYFALQTRN